MSSASASASARRYADGPPWLFSGRSVPCAAPFPPGGFSARVIRIYRSLLSGRLALRARIFDFPVCPPCGSHPELWHRCSLSSLIGVVAMQGTVSVASRESRGRTPRHPASTQSCASFWVCLVLRPFLVL